MKNYVQPTITGELYDPQDCIGVVDRYQMFLYIKHGAYPKDIYVVGEDLVMIFDKAETRDLYDRWRRRELS